MTAIRIGLYAATVIVLSVVHDVRIIALILAAVLALAGRDAPGLARRALLAVLLFSGVVSAAYVAASLWRGDSPWTWLLRTNLRVMAMTSLTLLVASRLDLLAITARFPTLQFVMTLVLAQIRTLRRVLDDFRLALRSRTLRRPGPIDALRHGGAVGGALLRRADHDLEARTRAMDARGFFAHDDRR